MSTNAVVDEIELVELRFYVSLTLRNEFDDSEAVGVFTSLGSPGLVPLLCGSLVEVRSEVFLDYVFHTFSAADVAVLAPVGASDNEWVFDAVGVEGLLSRLVLLPDDAFESTREVVVGQLVVLRDVLGSVPGSRAVVTVVAA